MVTVAYLHFILFRMRERVITTEMKFDIAIQMAVKNVLANSENQEKCQVDNASN